MLLSLIDWLPWTHGQNHQRNWTKCDTRYAPAFLSRQYQLFTTILSLLLCCKIFSPFRKWWNSELCVWLRPLSQSLARLLFITHEFSVRHSALDTLSFRQFAFKVLSCSRLWWDGGGGDTSQSNNVSFNFHSFSCDRPPVVCDCALIVASMSARISIVTLAKSEPRSSPGSTFLFAKTFSLPMLFFAFGIAIDTKMLKSANFSRKHNSCAFVMAVQREWFMADENYYLPVDNKASDLWHASCGDHSCFIGNFTLFIPPPHRNQRIFESNEIAT